MLAVFVYGLIGWALCGVTMGVAMAGTILHNALIIHAVAAPIIFAAVSFLYFRRSGSWSPLRAAVTFTSVVIAMDLFLVALFIERSFAMFRSPLGTWFPFLFIFGSTWLVGIATRLAAPRPMTL